MIVFTRELLMLFVALGCFEGAFAREISGNLKFAPGSLVILTGSEFPVQMATGGRKMVEVAYLLQDPQNKFSERFGMMEGHHQVVTPLGKMAKDLEDAVDILKSRAPRGKRYIQQRPRPCLFKICSMMGKRPHPKPNVPNGAK